MELVTPGIGLIFWMTLSFSILLFILGKFAWKPILTMLKEREQSIEDALNAAEKAKEEMRNLQTNNEMLLKKTREERDEILKEARKAKDAIVDDAKVKATEEANIIVERARETIMNEKMAAITDLKNQIAQLSVDIAEKIIKEELSDEKKQQAYISKLVSDIKIN
ncbi:MAG: F0F1 ATP synthase subunit B [Bacteroidota bacterium]